MIGKEILFGENKMCEICICENPLTSEERTEYERILMKYKDNELRDYLWSKLTTGEHIRFLHYLVMMHYKMEKVLRADIY